MQPSASASITEAIDPERWQQLRRVFHLAIEHAPDERCKFLDQACENDLELRCEVDRLLKAHEEAGSLLEVPPFATRVQTETPPLESGVRLGPYEITGLLGTGGMGEVYRARDTRLGREVAVKVLPRGLFWSPERLARFEQEARAASALNHPHIIAVYDVGSQDGAPYLVTELLEGQTLSKRIAHGPVSVRKALEWSVQIARGLAAAHARGVVHRDLKPANVFVMSGGQVKILDFGLAKLTESSSGMSAQPGQSAAPNTAPGLPIGTLGYMSPEQVRGGLLDFRSDQFSLGCVLYELLTGEPPFRRQTDAQALAAVLEEEPAASLQANPRVPPPLAWIVERCLAKEPEDRYAATHDLLRDLELTLIRSLRPNLAMTRAPRPGWRWVFGAALMGAAITVAGVVALSWGGSPPLPPAVPVVRYLTYSGYDSSPAASPDGRTMAFSSRRDGRRRIWLMQTASGDEVPLTEGEDDHPRFSPDGSTILFSRKLGNRVSLYRLPSLGGEPRKLIEDALYGDFSPDGRQICWVRQLVNADWATSVLGTASLDGSQIKELTRLDGRALIPPRWSPDGREVAIAVTALQTGQRATIALVNTETGNVRSLTPPPPSVSPSGLTWTETGGLAYSLADFEHGLTTGSSSKIFVHDPVAASARSVLSSPLSMFTPDILGSGRLVFEARSFRINLEEIALSKAAPPLHRRWLTRGGSSDRQPTYSPDGEWVVYSSNRGGNLDLWAVSRGSAAIRRLTDDGALDWDPSFTRDGKLLWSSNRTGNFEVWMAESDGTGAQQLTHDGVDAQNPTMTPDGEWIIYTAARRGSRGIMKVRPDGSGATRLASGNVLLPEVSPDGQYVAFVANLGGRDTALRFARVSDSKPVDFEIPVAPWVPAPDPDVGRCRWLPDGRAVAFIDQAPDGTYAVYVQDFMPFSAPAAERRRLVALDPSSAAESFGLSPDGLHMTVAYWDRTFSLALAENVPDIR